jgi:hypothetical protein
MYYDNKNKIIINKLPKNCIDSSGNFIIDFDQITNINILADNNYYTIRNDIPLQPSDLYIEEISKRIINIEYPYADIIRSWRLESNSTEA